MNSRLYAICATEGIIDFIVKIYNAETYEPIPNRVYKKFAYEDKLAKCARADILFATSGDNSKKNIIVAGPIEPRTQGNDVDELDLQWDSTWVAPVYKTIILFDITTDCFVLVIANGTQLDIYGHVPEMIISSIAVPWFTTSAVETIHGTYIIGQVNKTEARVSEVDASGRVIRSYVIAPRCVEYDEHTERLFVAVKEERFVRVYKITKRDY
jgi:hypothetical protein